MAIFVVVVVVVVVVVYRQLSIPNFGFCSGKGK